MVLVRFSSAVRAATNGDKSFELQKSSNVNEALGELSEFYGFEFKNRIMDGDKPRQYLNFYKNGKDIRYLDNLETNLTTDDILDIIPAIAGG